MRIRSLRLRDRDRPLPARSRGDALQAFFTAGATKGAGMQHQVVRLQGQGALDFTAKGCDRLGVKFRIAAGKIHQVVGMDGQGLQVVLRAEATHLVNMAACQLIGLPLAWARGENLQRVAAKPVSALGSKVYSSGGRSMDADAARGQPGRLSRRRQQLQNVFFFGSVCGAMSSIAGLILSRPSAVQARRRGEPPREGENRNNYRDDSDQGGPAIHRTVEGHRPGANESRVDSG